MKHPINTLLAAIAAALLLAACASIGRPEGGPRDFTPPKFVSSNPAPGSLNVKSQRISFQFDENIQLDDPGSKIVVSPTQKQQPQISSNARRLTIELRDTLLENTTYTIDLGDAVKDLNEGNVLDGFAIDFSTGTKYDTLRISGMVLRARDLEPAQGMLVGVYTTDADSAITSLPMERVTRTNQYGQFTLRNLPHGTYYLYAVNDVNRDSHWDRSEDVAFYGLPITPSVGTVEVDDTVDSSAGQDSIAARRVVRYLPNDLLLTWFNEEYKPQYMKNYTRSERRRLNIEMNAAADSLPQLTIVNIGSRPVNIPMESVATLQHTAGLDTLIYWITDTAIIASDSLRIATRYRRVDSLDNLTWQTDTLRFNFRTRKGEKPAKLPTLQEKIDSILAISDTIPIDTFKLLQPSVWLNINAGKATQELNQPYIFSTAMPVGTFDFAGVRLEMKPDSVWLPVEGTLNVMPTDTFSMTGYKVEQQWTPGMNYRLCVDSMAIHDIYGTYNKPTELEFRTRNVDDYSTLTFTLSGLPDTVPAIVELLNSKDQPVASAPVSGGVAELRYILPDTYYARLYIDSDGNGKYTNGNISQQLQPEDVYYFNKKLHLKKNWDRSELWDINALPPDRQKPDDIKMNKPRETPAEREQKRNQNKQNGQNDDEEDEEFDEFGSDFGSFNNQNRNQNQFRL